MLTISDHRAFTAFAIAGSLLFHLWLLWQVSLVVIEAAPTARPIQLTLIELPKPPPKPKPLPRVVVKPLPKPKVVIRPTPRPIVRHRTQPRSRPRLAPPPPPQHFRVADDSGLDMDLAPVTAGSANGSDAMGNFDDAVKDHILAYKTYPPGLQGMWNDCVVAYTVTVDRHGNLLKYHVDACGNPFLDGAAVAAILKASPYPVPPDFGGDHYEVSGVLIYRH